MNGTSTLTEQSISKFHVFPVDKVPSHGFINADETSNPQSMNNAEESTCPSRFQMIRVDRNFGRGRWKVNDFEPPEMNSASIVTGDHDGNHATTALPLISTDGANNTVTVPLPVTSAASVPTAFPPQRLSINNTPLVLSHGNVPSPAGLLHAYPPGALANLATTNQSYLLANHAQFGYYPFYPPPYSAYAAQWAALAAANPYLPPPPPLVSPIPTQTSASASLNDPLRLTDTDLNSDNPVISSASYSTSGPDHHPNGATATTPFLYAPRHSHSPYVPQHSANSASPYATIPSYHPVAPLPTIVPPSQGKQSSNSIQKYPSNLNELSQSNQTGSQQAPTLISPKHETMQTLIEHPALIITPKVKPPVTTTSTATQITDLISTSPSLTTSQQAPISLLSPIATAGSSNLNPATTAAITDIWTYTNGGSPLNLSQTAAAAAISLLNHETTSNDQMTNKILKELTTPNMQNNTADIDGRISAAMDLVKTHLLIAVREEVAELRQQIRNLQDKLTSVEHENTFLRQNVSQEIHAQYIPILTSQSSSNDSTNSSQVTSSQMIPIIGPPLSNTG